MRIGPLSFPASRLLFAMLAELVLQAGCTSGLGDRCPVGTDAPDAAPVADVAPLAVFTPEAQAVYAALLRTRYGTPWENSNPPSYVLRNQTFGAVATAAGVASESYMLISEFERLSCATLESFWSSNQQNERLPTDMDLGAPYVLLDEKTFLSLVSQPGYRPWNGFYNRFPDAPGFLRISHVGIDQEKRQALVLVSWIAGSLEMTVDYYLLEWDGETWTVVDEVTILMA